MKRILSLFLSIVMMLSMCISNVSISAFASDEDKTMIEKTNVTIDMTNVTGITPVQGTYTNTGGIAINGVKQHWLYFPKHESSGVPGFTVSEDTTTFGDSVMKMVYVGTYAEFYPKAKMDDNKKAVITPVTGSRLVISGKHYQTVESQPSWDPGTEYWIQGKLKPNIWYNFEVIFNFNKNMEVYYTQILSDEEIAEGKIPHKSITNCKYVSSSVSRFRFRPRFAAAGETVYLDDLKIYWEEVPYEKAEIKDVGTKKIVDGEQNIVPITLSADIPKLTEQHITVTNEETDQNITVNDIEITSDGTNPVVKVKLASNLASWAKYRVTIGALAFGEGSKQRTGDGEAVDVTDISEEFETPKPPFATKGFEFTASGDNLNAKGLVVNTTGTPKDVKLVFSTFNSAGEQVEIAPTNYNDFNDAVGENLEADINTANAEKFNFFIIDNWENRTPLLGVHSVVDAFGNNVSQVAESCGALNGAVATIKANELDHTTFKLSFRIDTKKDGVTDGIIFVYKKGETLSDTNLPLYVANVATNADGTLKKEISLPELTLEENEESVEYVVEFVSEKLGTLSADFKHYSPEALIEARMARILEDAKLATTAAELKEILFGVNSYDEKVNSNFDLFGVDLYMDDYEFVDNKDAVFELMLSKVSDVQNFDELKEVFKEAAAEQKSIQIESTPTIVNKTTLRVDMTGVKGVSFVQGDYSKTYAVKVDDAKQHWLYVPSVKLNNVTYETSVPSFDDTTFKGKNALKFVCKNSSYLQIIPNGNITSNGVKAEPLSTGQLIMEGNIYNTVASRPSLQINGTSYGLDEGQTLNANTWYKFRWTVNFGSNVIVEYNEIPSDQNAQNLHSVIKTHSATKLTSLDYVRFFAGIKVDEAMYLDSFKMYWHDAPLEKAKVANVGTNNVAAFDQNKISLELSGAIPPQLAKEHISLFDEYGLEIKATNIEVLSDGSNTVNVTLSDYLKSYSDYIIKIDPACYKEGSTQLNPDKTVTGVTGITGNFKTSKLPFDVKDSEFIMNSGNLTAKAKAVNTTGSSQNTNLILSGFDAQGRNIMVSTKAHSVSSDGSLVSNLDISSVVTGCENIRFFAIDNWNNKVPVFGKSRTINASGDVVASAEPVAAAPKASSSAELCIDTFNYNLTTIKLKYNYDNNSIRLNVYTGVPAPQSGVITVYKKGQTLSDSALPVYIDYVETAADGSFTKDIFFASNQNMSFGDYIVEYTSNKLGSPLVGEFKYHTLEERHRMHQQEILKFAKKCTTSGALAQVILGIDSSEKLVSKNFDVISKDAGDYMTYYNNLKNKGAVFYKMIDSIGSVKDYSDLIKLFKDTVKNLSEEGSKTPSPSYNNSSYGGSFTPVKETVNAPVQSGSANASVFADMSGHWASTYVEALAKRGVMKGYEDGSFRGNNSITRAEIAKTIVEAFEIAAGDGKTFADVSAGSWYTDYVASAAQAGIVTGFADGTFGPDIAVTRQDAALMIYRALSTMLKLPIGYTFFNDDLDIADYASGAIRTLGDLGIITGDEGKQFKPNNSITRAEIATIICRALDYVESH